MDVDIITQYVLAIVPAFTAIVGMIVTLGVGIGKIKKANTDTVDTVERSSRSLKEENAELKSQLIDVHKENVEIKRQLKKLMAKMDHIHFVEDKEE